MIKTPVAQAIDIAYSPNPVLPADGRIFQMQPALPGQTLRAVLVAAGIDPHQEIVIRHNGDLLPVAQWDQVVPVAGDTVQVLAAVSGGGGGGDSNPLQVVAMIALTYFTMGGGAGLWASVGNGMMTAGGALTFAGSMVAGAMMMAGSMLLGSLFKPETPSINQVEHKTSAVYSLAGGSNRMRPYEPLMVVLGRYRVFPDLNSKPFVEYQDNEQYLYQIFNFGLGNPQLSDPRIGDTSLEAFEGVSVVWPDANGTFPPESGFYGNVDTTQGAEITAEMGAIVRTTAADTVRIGIDIEGVLFAVSDDGNWGENSVQIRVRYRPVGGAWSGFVDAANVTTVSHYWSSGYWRTSQTAPDRYVDGVWTPAETTQVWVQTAFDNNLDPNAHTEGESNGSIVDPNATEGSWITSQLPLLWRWVAAGTDPRPVAATESNGDDLLTLRGASSEQKRWSFYRWVPEGQYDVEIVRVSPDDDSTKRSARLGWSSLKSYQADQGVYKNQCVVGLKIRASSQLSGSIQQFSCVAQSSCYVHTPTGWQIQGSLNPAWWYLHWAMGQRDEAGRLLYGCGLDVARLDLEAITAWAAFCEQENLSFSTVIDSKQSADEVLQMIARCGLASPSWAPGKLSVVWDRVNASVSAAFGMSNILAGTFSVKYLTEQLADEIVVDYLDADTWQSGSVRITAPGLVGVPQRSSQITLQGCTSNAHALKYARVVMAGNAYRRRRITWETDAEGFVCTRGDVVRLSHDLTQWDYSGRLVSVSGNTVQLSRAVPRSAASDFLTVIQPDGTQHNYTATPGTGDEETLTLTSSVLLQPDYPARDHLFFYGPLVTPGKRVKILSVEPVDQRRLRITATDDDPAYYTAWGGNWIDPTINTRLVVPVSVSNLLLRSDVREINGRITNQVTASWRAGTGVVHCAVDVSLDGELQARYEAIKTNGKTFEIANGTVRVGVTPYSVDGVAGPQVFASLEVSTAPPLSPPLLTASPALFAVQLSWLYNTDRTDIDYTELRWAVVADQAQSLALTVAPYPGNSYLHAGLQPGMAVWYWARAIDTRGVPSAWSAAVPAVVVDDPSDMLDMLKDAVGLQHIADELAQPIEQIPLIQMAQDWDALTAEINRLGGVSLVKGERVQAFAAVSVEKTERVTEAEALAEQITLVASGMSGLAAAVETEESARVDADSANAQLISNVQARLDTGDFAAVKTSATASANKLGQIEAKYVIKVDANGKVAGMELLSDGTTSAMVVLADKLLFAKPDGSGTPKQVFMIGTVNGQTALGFDGTMIVDGSIVASKIDTRGLTIKDASGNVIFGAGTGLPASLVTGLGTLATQNSVSASNVSGLGSLATQSSVSASSVTGLGTLATQNSVSYSAVTGTKPPTDADKTSSNTAAGIANQGAFATLSKITSGNISTYISDAAIGSAYIADAAITSAKIGSLQVQSANIADLTVGTNKITGNSITNAIGGKVPGTSIPGFSETLTVPSTAYLVTFMVVCNSVGYGDPGVSIRINGTYVGYASPGLPFMHAASNVGAGGYAVGISGFGDVSYAVVAYMR